MHAIYTTVDIYISHYMAWTRIHALLFVSVNNHEMCFYKIYSTQLHLFKEPHVEFYVNSVTTARQKNLAVMLQITRAKILVGIQYAFISTLHRHVILILRT